MGVLFAALTTLCMLSLISAFYQADKVAVTLTLVNVGDVALFGLVIDRVSTLILFVVVFLGLLVTIYSTGYLTDKNREHPHNGTNRYYAFLLVFIGAMAGLVLSSTLLGQLLFFEITGGCSWALINYYQSDKAQRSALKALLITHIGSLGLYLAAATLFLQTHADANGFPGTACEHAHDAQALGQFDQADQLGRVGDPGGGMDLRRTFAEAVEGHGMSLCR